MIFCHLYRFQRWLHVEAVLARSQAQLDIIPARAARAIGEKADIRLIDLSKVKREIKHTGHSLVPLLNALREILDEDSGSYVHHGATTQDIQDTGLVLELKDYLETALRDLELIIHGLIGLTERYKGLPMTGRTHSQQALPMTLGLKIASWLDELSRGHERLLACQDRVLVSQLFGGVGTMDALGKRALKLLEVFSNHLGLKPPPCSWHAARDRIADLLCTIGIIAGGLGRIANEIRTLSRSEVGELEEPFHMGKVGSSTMPHKVNPEMCEQVVVLSRLIKANAGLGLEGLINEHERDYRAVRMEWVSVTDTCLFFAAILSLMKRIIQGLVVHKKRIEANLVEAASFISSEALMFLLADKIGLSRAHQLVYEASMAARAQGKRPIDILLEDKDTAGLLDRRALDAALNPRIHTGLSVELADRVSRMARQTIPIPARDWERRCPILEDKGTCQIPFGS